MDSYNDTSPRGIPNIQFDPDKYPHATLKAFNDFVEQYEFRYEAQYPEPPKHIVDAASVKWKSEHDDTDPNAGQKVTIRDDLVSKDKVKKLMGFFATNRLQQDWKAAEPTVANRNCTWTDFLTKMRTYYKPTENPILRNFEFSQLKQLPSETFSAFANRVEKEGKTCSFCSCIATSACDAEATAIRGQIVIGTHNEKIRERAFLKSWSLVELRREGMKIESAMHGEEKVAQTDVNKVGTYSYKNIGKYGAPKHKKFATENKQQNSKKKQCYRCGEPFSMIHLKKCPAINNKCTRCSKVGHYAKVCNNKEVNTNSVEDEAEDEAEDEFETYTFNNVWRVKSTCHNPKHVVKHHDFKARVLIKNKLPSLLVDTGAKVSVCGMKQAKQWGILDLLQPSKAKIRPYQSDPISVRGTCTTAVTFGKRTIPVEFYVLPGSCEPILAGKHAELLEILTFQGNCYEQCEIYSMIAAESNTDEGKNFYNDIQDILSSYPQCYKGIGHLKNHQVKFYIDNLVKPVVVPRRHIPYHLRDRVDKVIQEMLAEDIIELQPSTEPAPWVSAPVIVPKADGSIRITLDARNINKALQANNMPIPRMEDIKAQLSGAKYFSKMDLKAAYWQLELQPEVRYLTVFECNGKLYRYKRLLMGVKPAQGELTMALQPVFAHIPNVYLIHDDLVIGAETMKDHNEALAAVMEAIATSGLTLNPSKCSYGQKEIKFWGMIFSEGGVRPDPEKVDALDDLPPPQNKEELKSFICMMQSNSDFIGHFSRKIAPLRELLKKNARFSWNDTHQKIFEEVTAAFKKDTLLRYFDLSKQTYIFVDGHKTGLCAILAQGDSIASAKPVDIKSRCTNKPEQNGYPQLDLEGMAVDFALRRFRQYLVGAPEPCIIVTDHKPLLGVFNGRRNGSIRTETIKLRHQNIRHHLMYRKGTKNSADYGSRHARPWKTLPRSIKGEADEITNLLYTLRLSPIVDALGIREIAEATQEDPCLSAIQRMLAEGKSFIPRDNLLLARFRQVYPEITCLANGTLLMQDRIILPSKLVKKAVRLAHMGAHPGQNGLLRRLRSHFYIPNIDEEVKQFVETCIECQTFTNKNTREPIQPNKVPSKCWEEVSVDLFGPLPSSNHIVVIQDLASRFPVAKVVRSTGSKSVLPVLAETYNTFGNPETQKSDNGPPFNSKDMENFTEKRNIVQVKTPPGHPAANNVETVMKPLGKAMKIGINKKASETETLHNFLQSYRDTPHSATGIPPGAMIFRDGYRSVFPRKELSANKVAKARASDSCNKDRRKAEYNLSRHTKPANYEKGDQVLVRNFYKRSKYEPYFLPERFLVTDTLAQGKIILVQSSRTGRFLKRHPNDLKHFEGQFQNTNEETNSHATEENVLQAWKEAFESIDSAYYDNTEEHTLPSTPEPADVGIIPNEEQMPRRTGRATVPNPKYFNRNFVNE